MDDILLLDTTERYLKGELNAEDRAAFEQLRQTIPEVDQMVVEHNMFLNQINAFGQNREYKHHLHEVHNNLEEAGVISATTTDEGKVVPLWKRYKKVIGIAATIASVTALVISALVTYFTPANKGDIVQLNRKINQVMHSYNVQSKQLNELKSKVPMYEKALNGGTSFLIDGSGFLVTNAHVVKGSSTILVQNNKGQEFKAIIAHIDNVKDLAILKIDDEDFKSFPSLPYRIRKGATDLGEPIYTLGFPKDEIVYNEGYMSAKTGYNGDTISYQIAVSANPGNSGGPVFNRNGEVIGILSTSQPTAQGVVFAIKSRNVHQAIDSLKKVDTTYQNLKVSSVSNLKGLDRVQQIKQIQDCVFMVKSFTK
ncbi:serine protease [Segetibacter sp.]|jgi:serine protease Do|uniref:S1C family serine protease n=1 Tax=Segetibacter sp. TaxID=2231182 RepID=UPI002622F8E6|nr:serine protease [Segetibacter sp.]MCW3080950.1 trypsin-like peptidase protein [Segetibacter sp.]